MKMKTRPQMTDMAFRLAAARAKKADMTIPESKKTLEKKLEEIAADLEKRLRDAVNIHPVYNQSVTLPSGETITFPVLYPISAVAFAVGRTTTLIRIWESEKILPKATLRTPSGRRLYHILQIALIVYLAEKHDIGQGKKLKGSEFHRELNELWPRIKKHILTPKKGA